MKSCIIKLDEPRAKSIRFTSNLFEGGIIFDRLPQGIYISSLYTKKGCFIMAMDSMFNEIDRTHLKVRFTAPDPRQEIYLMARGYVRYVDPAGSPNYTNTTIPDGCELSPRTAQWIEETEQLLRQTDSECVG